MKKLLTLLWLTSAAALIVSGAEKLRIADATGSGMAAFSRIVFGFATQNDVEIAYHRLEVATALEKLSLGETDLVLLRKEDLPKDFSGAETVCAYRVLVAVVNMRNPLRGITRNHLKRLLSEPRPRWDFKGGSGAEVRRVALKGRDGGPLGFGQLGLFKTAPGILALERPEQLWLFVGANVEALAVLPFARELPEGLTALKIDGAAPTLNNIRSGRYPLTEVFCAVTAAAPAAPARGLVRCFAGREFSDLLEEEGALAPPPRAI